MSEPNPNTTVGNKELFKQYNNNKRNTQQKVHGNEYAYQLNDVVTTTP